MKLSTFLFVFLSSWKATNAFLPLQARAFTLATTKPTTSSSLNSEAEHEHVADYRKGISESRKDGKPDDVRTLLYPYYLSGGVAFYRFSHFIHSLY
jgi:hypothetical protein